MRNPLKRVPTLGHFQFELTFFYLIKNSDFGLDLNSNRNLFSSNKKTQNFNKYPILIPIKFISNDAIKDVTCHISLSPSGMTLRDFDSIIGLKLDKSQIRMPTEIWYCL